MNKYQKRRIQSLCWDCCHALKCDWILNKKQVWKEAIEKRKCYPSERKEFVSYIVVACNFFKEVK